ncbi:exocyst subunit EXO70 family protein [Striga asiatica]|uniref:Exocyst subunit Exo70 family protein n=1 Tax=Striga asiatica TaxID=4170 RepID=A0A5A7QK91_STRAF|nr:exocyst subunit EXO70 family protein [Striga asiatica]
MGDCTATTTSVVEEREEEDLVASVEEIVKALELKKKLSADAKKILANLGSRLISISRAADESEDEEEPEEEKKQHVDVERQLDTIQDKIMYWEKNHQSMIWDSGPQEAHEYLESTDQIRKIIDELDKSENDSFSSNSLIRAHDLLQLSMSRLEDEFRHLLLHNRQTLEPEHVSFRSSEDENIDSCSIISSGDDSVDSTPTGLRAHDEYATIELIRPEAISDLRSIANSMFDSSYGRECVQAFASARKDDDCLSALGFERLGVEDVLKMEWGALDSRIRRWVRASKLFVRVHLAAERALADRVLGPAGPACFSESARPAFLSLLDFADAIAAIGPHGPEKLIRILDMREALSGLGPDLETLFGHGPNAIRAECADVLARLDGCLRATFLEFETAVGSNVSSGPFPGGGVHPLTKYVMNYMLTLTDYDETLNEVLRDPQGPDQEDGSTMGRHFRALTLILERNLEGKSGLYRDEAQQHLFLMNNVHYMAEKVKGSELRKVFGDDWIRKHNRQFQQHAVNYERATWSSIIGLLKDEGLQNPVSRGVLKERLQRFYGSFEEVYKSQTGWSVRDGQLREDLRIWTSLNVVQAYRTFVGRHMNHVSERYVKYTADDLEEYVLDLFEGSQKSLHGGHKR